MTRRRRRIKIVLRYLLGPPWRACACPPEILDRLMDRSPHPLDLFARYG